MSVNVSANTQPLVNPILENRMEECLKKIQADPEWSVLELGCADLRPYSLKLIGNFKNYVGLDKNEKFVRLAQEKLSSRESKASIKTGRAEEIQMDDGAFDLVICNNMLAYSDKKRVLSQVHRLLKKGGYCLCLSNNTIDYSLYKMRKPQKFFLTEFLHSIIVIVNTWFYRVLGVRLFRTTYNTLNEFRSLFKIFNPQASSIELNRQDYPYAVIDCLVQK